MTAQEQMRAETGGESPEPSEDDLFDMLANSRRRHLIELLAAEQERHDIGTLSTRVAARENAVDVNAVTSDERKRVYTALQQSHLPKLDSAGFIEFDKQRGTVHPLSKLATAEQYLTVARSENGWYDHYLALAATSALVVGAVWGGFWPFVLVSPLGWAVCIVAVFGGLAAAHRSETSSSTGVW